MKILKSLIWKEWRESQIYLWIGWGIFIVLPAIGELERIIHTTRRFVFDPSMFVLPLGWLLVIFIAVGCTCRDFTRHVEIFWQSRPVGITRWLLIKYVVGLSIALLVCGVPVALGMWSAKGTSRDIGWVMDTGLLFYWVAVYSIAFAGGCLLRRPAQAAMLAVVLMLVLIFLPALYPRLAGLGLFGRAFFFSIMVGVALAALIISLAIVRFDWRIQAGARMVFSAIAAAVLLTLFAVTSRFGTALPTLQTLDLPPLIMNSSIFVKGDRGLLLLNIPEELPHIQTGGWAVRYSLRPFTMTPSGVMLGSARPAIMQSLYNLSDSNDSAVACYTDLEASQKTPAHLLHVWLISLDGRTSDWKIDVPAAWEPIIREHDFWYVYPYVLRDRLYVWLRANPNIGHARMATIDISDPAHPRVISDEPFDSPPEPRYRPVWYEQDDQPHRMVVPLPQISGVSPHDRLLMERSDLTDGDHLFGFGPNRINELTLTRLTDSEADFELVNHVDASFADALLGRWDFANSKCVNGFLYVLRPHIGPLNGSVSVYDTLVNPMRQVAHFAAPDVRSFGVLPDGRMLVAGDKLWLVAAPRHE